MRTHTASGSNHVGWRFCPVNSMSKCDQKFTPRPAINADAVTIAGFGFEWSRFDQSQMGLDERQRNFNKYFSIFPWELLPVGGGTGADIGCGSGRWAVLMAPRVARLHLVDASAAALAVARNNLAAFSNVNFHLATADTLPFADDGLDFAFSLGVLHHLPDTAAAIHAVVRKLKPGAPFLIYLYYAFDNRSAWYRWLWRVTDGGRRVISRLPNQIKYGVSQVIAAALYWPLARAARILNRFDIMPAQWPLNQYRDASFYVMRTDALDRFGTKLERRFTRAEIHRMMAAAGLEQLRFSETAPYWCAVGVKRLN